MESRSPIYEELYDDGALMPWEDFLHHIADVRDWTALSEHRTLLADLLALRNGLSPAYDWTQGDGTLPFGDVAAEDLTAALREVDARVRADLPDQLQAVPLLETSSLGQWTVSGDTARWSHVALGDEELTDPLGRRMRLACPAPAGVPYLLGPVFTLVTQGLEAFGPCQLPPFDEVWDIAQSLARGHGQTESSLCCELTGIRVGPVRGQSASDCLLQVSVRAVEPEAGGLNLVSIDSPSVHNSPLHGTPLDYSGEWHSYRHRTPADDYLVIETDRTVASTMRGSLVWSSGDRWLTPAHPLRPNPVIDQAIARGHIDVSALGTEELRSVPGPLMRVTDCAQVSTVLSLDGQELPRGGPGSATADELARLLNPSRSDH